MPASLTSTEKQLIRRYLIWCYKTTKEEIDRTDRKFTQLLADEVILKELLKKKRRQAKSDALADSVQEFRVYIEQKQKDTQTIPLKYPYLKARLTAVEKAIVWFLGKRELKAVRELYEIEMTRRILEARDH